MNERRREKGSLPEIAFVFGQLFCPLLMAGLDRLGRGAVGQSRRLGAERYALGQDLEASAGCHPVEGTEAERVEHCREGRARIVRQCVPQRQRALRRQLGDEPFRQRLEAIVLFARTLQKCILQASLEVRERAHLVMPRVKLSFKRFL